MPRTGGSFRGLVSYLTSNRGKIERVGSIRLSNCVSVDVASAVLEVENEQARNYRARHTTYHLMLSFREQPPDDVIEAIEHRACTELGFGDHQRASVVHHDTDHVHVHIAINRVDPRTHTVHWPSYSKLVLDRLCVELERQYGLSPDRHLTRGREGQLRSIEDLRATVQRECSAPLRDARSWAELHAVAERHGVRVELRGNGLAFVATDGVAVKASSVARELSKAALERRLGPFEAAVADTQPRSQRIDQVGQVLRAASRRPPDVERVSGFESLIGFVQRECAEGLRAARSWAEVHEVAAAHGFRARLRGNGLIFVAGERIAVKASSVARDLSKAALERRLGPFEASNVVDGVVRVQYRKRPLQRVSAALYERYLREREACIERRDRAVAHLREQRDRERERLQRNSRRRWAAVRFVAKGRVAWLLWSARARTADRRELERARQRHRTATRAAICELARTSWLEWLRDRAAQGDHEALAALRLRARGGRLQRNALCGEAATPLRAPVDSVTATGTVIYRVLGCSIRDDGARLYLTGSDVSASAAETLVRIAHARYGSRIGVEGDDAFRAQMVRAAVSSGLPITFADEQLERRRGELERKEHPEGRLGLQRPRPLAPLSNRGRSSQRKL